MTQNPNIQIQKPDLDKVTQLIINAPIGGYIGEEGARVFAEHACNELILKKNDFLFQGGEKTTSFYLVTEGSFARIKDSKKGKTRILHTLHKGDLVGELSFIDETDHARSVMALEDSAVLQFRKEDIEPLITKHPRLIFNFMRAVIKRVHHTVNDISKQQMALSDYIGTAGKGRM